MKLIKSIEEKVFDVDHKVGDWTVWATRFDWVPSRERGPAPAFYVVFRGPRRRGMNWLGLEVGVRGRCIGVHWWQGDLIP